MTDSELWDWLERNGASLMYYWEPWWNSDKCWYIQHPILNTRDREYHSTPRAAVESACLRLEMRAKERKP